MAVPCRRIAASVQPGPTLQIPHPSMTSPKQSKPKARLPRGFRDRVAAEIIAEHKMLGSIRAIYEAYGFEPLETPAFEYTDALGKFLPDVDRPNEGVFSLKDDDEQWLSLALRSDGALARLWRPIFRILPSPFAAIKPARCGAMKSPGRGATANSPIRCRHGWLGVAFRRCRTC
jgi:hypothetical protein